MILSAVCLFTYPYVIQYKRGGWHRAWAPVALAVWLLDVIANYTEWAIIFGWPRKGDYTISNRLDWMEQNDPFESRRELARMINVYLNACEHDGVH